MVRWLQNVLDSDENEVTEPPTIRPRVRVLATPEGFVAIRAALTWLATERPPLFARLFGPGRTRPSVQARPDDPEGAAPIWVSETLFNHGLLEKRGSRSVAGTVPIRRVGERLYLQALGLPPGFEYQHEDWPETEALLAALPQLATSGRRLLDVGTGCGIVAIEARLAGFEVVATDADPACLMLAGFNARLNGVDDLDLRQGSGLVPVAAERFDAVVCNPDYGGVRDQMRVEILQTGVAALAPGGLLLVATMLEWQEQLPLEVPLGELVVRGYSVTVEPIVSTNRASWFTMAAPGSVPGVPSRHRFTIRVTPSARPELRVRLPSGPSREFVPLAMVKRVDQIGVVTTLADVRALVDLVGALTAPEVVLDGPLPYDLLDGCRFGAQPCVGARGAAGAIVHGISLRPCAHGEAVGRATMSMQELAARYEALDRELQLRRGCPTCVAYTVCSRCQFTGPLAERDYCEVSRGLLRTVGLAHRLFETRQFLGDEGVAEGPLRLLRGPLPDPVTAAGDEEPLGALVEVARRWRQRYAWAVEQSGRGYLQIVRDQRLQYHALTPLDLDLLLSLARGGGVAALAQLGRAHPGPPGHIALAVTRLLDRLGA